MADGKAAKWFKGLFGSAKMPKGPTADDLYGGPTAFGEYQPYAAQVQADPRGMNASMEALQQLQGFASRNVNPAANQQFTSYLRQGQQASGAQRQAALQAAQARGTFSGGGGLAAGLAGASADANAAADAAAQMAAASDSQRMQAAGQVGALGANLSNTQYSQQAANAAARDAFNQWASEQRSGALQAGHANAVARAEAQRNLLQRIGSSAANIANSWISNAGSDD